MLNKKKDETSIRAKVIERFLEVAKYSLTINCYSIAFQILLAVSDFTKLKHTWEGLQSFFIIFFVFYFYFLFFYFYFLFFIFYFLLFIFYFLFLAIESNYLNTYKLLRNFFSESGNYKNYRGSIKSINNKVQSTPTLCCFPILLRDISITESINEKFKKNKAKEPEKLINFQKFELYGKIVSQYYENLSVPFKIVTNQELSNYLEVIYFVFFFNLFLYFFIFFYIFFYFYLFFIFFYFPYFLMNKFVFRTPKFGLSMK